MISGVMLMSVLTDYVQAEAEKKGVPPGQWLTDMAKNAGKCQFATHIGRFVNPDVTVNWQAKVKDKPDELYVSTASVKCSPDIFVAANYLATASLLQLHLEDGRTLYEHLQFVDDDLQEDFQSMQVDYDQLREDLLAIKSDVVPDATDKRLRQVYFPVRDDGYHLLTVLPPASLMQEMRLRIRAMEETARLACTKKSESYGSDHRRIYNLVQTKFGGTKPQNISYGNNRQGGRSYMLPALPPVLEKRNLIYPRRDFFRETLRRKDFIGLFHRLHKRYVDTRNNLEIRQAVRSIEQQIMEMVLQRVYVLREKHGWTENRSLSRAQMIWLDDKYIDERYNDEEWQKQLAIEFADWMLAAYEKIIKKEKVELGDGELTALRKEAINFIRSDLQKQ